MGVLIWLIYNVSSISRHIKQYWPALCLCETNVGVPFNHWIIKHYDIYCIYNTTSLCYIFVKMMIFFRSTLWENLSIWLILKKCVWIYCQSFLCGILWYIHLTHSLMLTLSGRGPHLCLCKQVGSRLAWDPTCLLLSQNLKVLKSRRQYNLFLENYQAFEGLNAFSGLCKSHFFKKQLW